MPHYITKLQVCEATRMAKIGRNGRSGQFVTVSTKRAAGGAVNGAVTIRDDRSGRELPLRGYGAMKDKFVIKPGVDVSKPISAQAGQSASKK
jgi:hypothetical protein